MKFLYANKLSVLAFALIVISNVVILYGVYANKAGKPTSQLTLTQRELQLPYHNANENSAITFRINYQILNNARWLQKEKLNELGFDTAGYTKQPNRADFVNRVQKERFIVLEYAGDAYQEALAAAREKIEKLKEKDFNEKQLAQAKKELQNQQLYSSKLFAIDADTDPAVLRAKYQDKTKYLITKGIVGMRYTNNTVHGYLSRLSIEQIYVPLAHSKELKRLQPRRNTDHKKGSGSEYEVTLKYGSRFEPYVTSVTLLKN